MKMTKEIEIIDHESPVPWSAPFEHAAVPEKVAKVAPQLEAEASVALALSIDCQRR
jgi:hypothetical protein